MEFLWKTVWRFFKKLNIELPCHFGTSLVAQMVENLPAIHEIRVWTWGQEDTVEMGMANHSSILAWKNPWTEKSGRLQFLGSQRVRPNWAKSMVEPHNSANLLLGIYSKNCELGLRLFVYPCSSQHYSQKSKGKNNPTVHRLRQTGKI